MTTTSTRSKHATRAFAFLVAAVLTNAVFGGAQAALDAQGAFTASLIVWAIGRVIAAVLIYLTLVNGYRGRAEAKAGLAGGNLAIASVIFGWILAVLWIVSVVTTLILLLAA